MLEGNITFPEDNQTAWNITSIPINDQEPDPFLPNSYIREHPSLQRTTARQTFNDSSVLTTSSVDSVLRFAVPRNTTLVKLYGSVGPDIGAYSVRMVTRDPYRPMNRTNSAKWYNATRPVYATGQLLFVTLLDDMPEWEMEVTMRGGTQDDEAGGDAEKRLEINGAIFTTFLREETGTRNNVGGSWMDYQNRMTAERVGWGEDGGGLSGGQIAGIVVSRPFSVLYLDKRCTPGDCS